MGFSIEREARELVETTAAKYGAHLTGWRRVDNCENTRRAVIAAGPKSAAIPVVIRGKGPVHEVIRDIVHETTMTCRRMGIVVDTLDKHAKGSRNHVSAQALQRNSDGPQTVAQAQELAALVFAPRPLTGPLGERLKEAFAKPVKDAVPFKAPVRVPVCVEPAPQPEVAISTPEAEPSMTTSMHPNPNGSANPPVAKPRPGKHINRANRGEVVQITRCLMDKGVVVDGVYVYTDGWSDEVVRNSVNPSLAIHIVKDIRVEGFGRVEAEIAKSATKLKGEAAILALQNEVASLREMVARLTARLDAAGVRVN